MKLQNIHPHTWLVLIPVHVLFIYSITQFANVNLFSILLFLFSWILISGLGVELGLHRYFSHGSFECGKWTARAIGFLSCLALNGSPIFWVAVHNGYHHRYVDTDKDPHSPIHGFWTSYIGWTTNKQGLEGISLKYAGRRLLGDPFFHTLQQHYYKIVTLTFFTIWFFVPDYFWLSFIPAVVASFNHGPITNVLCHSKSFGYANYPMDNDSRNIKWLSWFTWGLALHNNHHRYPAKANYAMEKGEFDLGYFLIKLFRFKHSQ